MITIAKNEDDGKKLYPSVVSKYEWNGQLISRSECMNGKVVHHYEFFENQDIKTEQHFDMSGKLHSKDGKPALVVYNRGRQIVKKVHATHGVIEKRGHSQERSVFMASCAICYKAFTGSSPSPCPSCNSGQYHNACRVNWVLASEININCCPRCLPLSTSQYRVEPVEDDYSF